MDIEATIAKLEKRIISIEETINLIMAKLEIPRPEKPPRSAVVGIQPIPSGHR